ncbi:5-oxoprolinase subunit PxpA [Burkholderia alba]|uniref:5-oxoprolinase subunit PxpA n=1 Tax=Burkholderia alba TaxID=2683677 RepID=UPI002B051B20|nr:5-oxoprolinase subunit PxpA [Burkholderia alba]
MTKQCIDLNCDMGDWSGSWRVSAGIDEQIMPFISSVNIATCRHAGDPNIMARTVQLARDVGIGIGAHPGFHDSIGAGRRDTTEIPQALVNDVLYQIGALRELARLHEVKLQHVKPYRALCLHAAHEETFSQLLVDTLQRLDPSLLLYCTESSTAYRVAREMGQPAIREFYADRDYDRSGSIALIRRSDQLDPDRVVDKVVRACVDRKVRTIDGDDIDIDFDSICIHSDTPGALQLVQKIHDGLVRQGIVIVRPQMLKADI